jgi:LuxR family maltose regulon positive regulatory protein
MRPADTRVPRTDGSPPSGEPERGVSSSDLRRGRSGEREKRARSAHKNAIKPGAVPRRSRPHLREGLISRPRLVRQLLDESQASTALIRSPPGYGKTSLLAEWIERDARPCAWVTLGTEHRHPAALMEAIGLALDELEPVDRRLLISLRRAASDRAAEPSEELLDALCAIVSSMGAERSPAVVVLDEAHVLKSRATGRVLSAVAGAIPPGAKLALASRRQPALQLGRMRAAGELLEIGERDLAMTAYEAHRMLRAAGLALDREALDRLLNRTEGWPAALYLAALALRPRAAADVAVERLGAADRAVHDYVRQELVSPLSKELREFLRRCSVLDQLSAPLCDTVLERSGSAGILETLAFEDLALLPLDADGRWYRCHGIVRDVLRAELEARESDSVAGLCARASTWFEEHGDIDGAIDHAVAAGETQRAGALLWSHAASFFMRGGDPRIPRWIVSLPDEQIARSPRLAVCAAFSYIIEPDLAAAERWARAASSALALQPSEAGEPVEGGIALIKAAIGRDGVGRMGREASQAESLLGGDSPWRSFCCLVQGVASHVSGERAAARIKLATGVRLSTALMPVVECLCVAQLAMIDAEDGDFERAADRAEVARTLVSSHALAHEPLAALVFAVSAWIAGRLGRGDEAKCDVTRATHLADQFDGYMPWYEVETRILIARASIGLADVATARASLSHASRVLRRISDAPEFHTWLDDGWADIDEHSASALTGPASLTIAELRILRFLPTHLSFREIGERLHVSTNTVKTQAHAVYGKLGAGSRSEAVARASALGLIEAAVV